MKLEVYNCSHTKCLNVNYLQGERKGQNKYYPPDFDYKKHKSLAGYHGQHPLRERARKLHMGILIIRLIIRDFPRIVKIVLFSLCQTLKKKCTWLFGYYWHGCAKYEVCDNGNAMKRCNFQNIMVSLHTGMFVVVHLYSTFSVDPQNFPIGINLYQKL